MAVEEIKKVTETEQEIKKQLENAAADGKQKVLERSAPPVASWRRTARS